MSIWPPRIMAKLSAEEKKLEVGSAVMVCLPALIEIRVLIAFMGKRADPQHAILALQRHMDAGGDVIGHQGRDADAQIDIIAVPQFPRSAGRHLFARPGH